MINTKHSSIQKTVNWLHPCIGIGSYKHNIAMRCVWMNDVLTPSDIVCGMVELSKLVIYPVISLSTQYER